MRRVQRNRIISTGNKVQEYLSLTSRHRHARSEEQAETREAEGMVTIKPAFQLKLMHDQDIVQGSMQGEHSQKV